MELFINKSIYYEENNEYQGQINQQIITFNSDFSFLFPYFKHIEVWSLATQFKNVIHLVKTLCHNFIASQMFQMPHSGKPRWTSRNVNIRMRGLLTLF